MKKENMKLSQDYQKWDADVFHRVPYWAYIREDIYKREMQKFFYEKHWCFVGFEVEVPNHGDFKKTSVGERSVIMVRDETGEINVIENVCAHRGVAFCRQQQGQVKDFVCPYHQWSYDLKGNLQGVPFLRGVKNNGVINGGMPKGFNKDDHGLTKLNVTVRNGVVFASFDHDIESFEDFLGPDVLAYFDRVFDGRELTILGYSRQRIPGNWKLMQENIKDPYHPGLLHTWFITFGLWRADQTSQMIMDKHHRHACMVSSRNQGGASEVTQNISSFKEQMTLHDNSLLDIEVEPWWGAPTAVMMTLFPSVIIQQQVNSLSTRHIQPVDKDNFDFVWTHFGFADDTPEMVERRVRQANLFGPAGFVSADDGEVIEFSQSGFYQKPNDSTIVAMDGEDVKNTDHMVTETLIRGMYQYWKAVMEDES